MTRNALAHRRAPCRANQFLARDRIAGEFHLSEESAGVFHELFRKTHFSMALSCIPDLIRSIILDYSYGRRTSDKITHHTSSVGHLRGSGDRIRLRHLRATGAAAHRASGL